MVTVNSWTSLGHVDCPAGSRKLREPNAVIAFITNLVSMHMHMERHIQAEVVYIWHPYELKGKQAFYGLVSST